jgi:endonuclease/exonuclease/phosphatase family metal-dependent hydrolase
MRMASWNVQSGGFYSYDPTAPTPPREEEIVRVVDHLHHTENCSSLLLTDTYRWDELYGSDLEIAQHLGYKTARYVALDDERLTQNYGPGVGITFATDEELISSEAITAYNRNALIATIESEDGAMQVVGSYFDDLDENTRLHQFKALAAYLTDDKPIIMTGDFNALRPHIKGVRAKVGDLVFRSLVSAISLLRPKSELSLATSSMNRRELIPTIESMGYSDADKLKASPTKYANGIPFPLISLDYAFSNEAARIKNFRLLNTGVLQKASDHIPIIFDYSPTDKSS